MHKVDARLPVVGNGQTGLERGHSKPGRGAPLASYRLGIAPAEVIERLRAHVTAANAEGWLPLRQTDEGFLLWLPALGGLAAPPWGVSAIAVRVQSVETGCRVELRRAAHPARWRNRVALGVVVALLVTMAATAVNPILMSVFAASMAMVLVINLRLIGSTRRDRRRLLDMTEALFAPLEIGASEEAVAPFRRRELTESSSG